uniref:FMRFamide-like neuropeptide SAPGQDFMRF-amide n=1 Tax=Delia radicum TaxID=30064 RepID=FAR8_DELRA|nr:RecName: Full=FMRFamide-like neuropeptide SAPGQDFMRF-amide [Delia radicum]
SAPGQDFMRF